MFWAEINWGLCQGCEACPARQACKPRAIVKFVDEPAFIELDRCRGCGKCVPACQYQAISLHKPGQASPAQG
jgi:Fe-S-cluster-containing hydrogenase component 2